MKRQQEREKFDEEQRIADMLVREEVRGTDEQNKVEASCKS